MRKRGFNLPRRRHHRRDVWKESCEPPVLSTAGNVNYCLWYYSADRSNTGLHVQQRRSRSARKTAENLFGEVLRERRRERGLTQESLAFTSGFHPTYIGQLERGQKSPSLRVILALAGALETRAALMIDRVELLLGKENAGTKFR